MQISKACHLCMTNNKNNRKIILLAFCVHFMYKWKGLKEKNSTPKMLAECVWNEIYSQIQDVYAHKTVQLYEEYCRVHWKPIC